MVNEICINIEGLYIVEEGIQELCLEKIHEQQSIIQ